MLCDESKQEGPEWLNVWGLQQSPLSDHALLDRGGCLEQDIVTLTVLCVPQK